MKKISLLLSFIICFSITNSHAQDSTKTIFSLPTKFEPQRNASADLDSSIVLAKKSGKRILLDVGGEWCKWCHYLDTLFLKNNDLSDFMHNNFVVLKINVSKENKNEEFLSHYPKVDGYPHIFILESTGTLLHSQNTGELEEGKGHSKEKVFAFLKRWVASK